MQGEEFATSALYIQRLQESDGHGAVKDKDDSMDTESDFSPSPSGKQSTDDVFGSITFDENICHEPCCRHYGTDYKCISEYICHADTGIHQRAVTLNKCIVASIPTGPALDAEQKAVRELRCISPHCLMFDQIFKTVRSFYKHLSEGSHRQGWPVNLGNAELDYNSDKDTLPGIEFSAGGRKGRCVNDKCPRYGMKFDSYGDMKQHARSFGHALTEEDLESTETEESGDEIWKKSDMPGIEVTECESLWRCIKEGCKGYNMIISRLGNARSHLNSDAHLMAADELSSSDESLEHLEGMIYSKDEQTWTCVKGGCKKFGNTIQYTGNARKHANTNAHVLAEEEVSAPGNPPEQEEMEGMGFSHEKDAWSCVRHACKGWGRSFTSVGYARLHANCTSHIKAGEDMVMTEQGMHESSIPKSPPMRTPAAQLLTPVDMGPSTIYVNPESPSSGRGINRFNTGSTPRTATSARTPKSIQLRRSSAPKAEMEKRQVELENKNRDLEERVSKLEEQMGQLLTVQSPQAPRSSSQASSPLTSVPQSPVSSASVIYTLSRFVRSPFRPRIPAVGAEEPGTFRRLPARPQVTMDDGGEEEEL
jgi:hypothetical protein